MHIKKSELVEMIREAVLRRVLELNEAPQGADPDPVEKGDEKLRAQKRKMQAAPDAPPPEEQGPDDAEPPADGEQPEDSDASAKANQDKADAIDAKGDAGTQTGQINRDIAGKRVQSLTVEEAKNSTGNKEIVLSFDEGTDAVRINVTPAGQVFFIWRDVPYDIP